jgi:hypothetical protein
MDANCVFVRDGKWIACRACGTRRKFAGDPEKYIRTCGKAGSVARQTPEARLGLILVDGVACLHRGDIVETGTCNVCGMRGQPFDVFACELHGKCMVRRFRNDRPELKVCVLCDDFRACRDAVLPLNA